MKQDLQSLDIGSLKTLCAQHQKELDQALLDGASWKDVQEKRKLVTELSILIDKRSSQNPAENKSR